MREVYYSARRGIGAAWRTLGRTLYPPHCLLCGARGAAGLDICAACRADLPLNSQPCARCANPLDAASSVRVCARCLRRPPSYERVLAPFLYAPPLDHLVLTCKFGARLEHGTLLGELLGQWLAHRLAAAAVPDRVLPVPLHPARLRRRGFDQASLIARQVAIATGVKLAPPLLRRTRATAAQAELAARQRRGNVRGAFRLAGEVRGLHLALLDDVMTTGSTVEEISRVLLRGGAASVQVWVVARAQPPAR